MRGVQGSLKGSVGIYGGLGLDWFLSGTLLPFFCFGGLKAE